MGFSRRVRLFARGRRVTAVIFLHTLPRAAYLRGAPRYLPTYEDFEHHLSNHRDLLRAAAKRGAGVLGIVSA
ncbi:MAG: hypothetical protein QM820_38910 [Minicystis sp.]